LKTDTILAVPHKLLLLNIFKIVSSTFSTPDSFHSYVFMFMSSVLVKFFTFRVCTMYLFAV